MKDLCCHSGFQSSVRVEQVTQYSSSWEKLKIFVLLSPASSLSEMSRVTVPILVDTNPYSLEKRKYGKVYIRTRIFPESNFFRDMEFPISGHVIETRRVKTCKRPYFSRLAENHGVPLMNATIFASHFH